MYKSFLLTALILAMSIMVLAQQDPKAKEILDAMSNKYKSISSFQADLSYTMTNKTEGIDESYNGKIAVKGDMYRLMMQDQEIYNDGTTRVVELSNFFVGPGKSVLELGDIVTAVILPVKKVASGFTKIGKRKALEISIMSMAISLELEGNKILNSKVACGSVGPTPMMAPKTEKLLNGLTVNSEADLQEAVEMVRTEVTPIDDIRGTATYRVRMAGISLKRLIMRIMEGAE